MQFLADNMSLGEIWRWIARRSKLLQPSRTQTQGIGQATSMEEQRKELAFMCRHLMSGEHSKGRREDDRWLPRPDHPSFSRFLKVIVRATLLARRVSLFGAAVKICPSKLSQAIWREVGEAFDDDDVLYGGYSER